MGGEGRIKRKKFAETTIGTQFTSYPLLYHLAYTSKRTAACTLILLLLPATQLPEFVFNP